MWLVHIVTVKLHIPFPTLILNHQQYHSQRKVLLLKDIADIGPALTQLQEDVKEM